MSLKEHPSGVAVTCIVATLTFCVTVIIPIWDKEKDNQIRDLRTEPEKLRTEVQNLKAQANLVEAENQQLRRDVDKLAPDSLFFTDNPYPRGFRSVRIGDRMSLLTNVYSSEGTLEDGDGWISVNFKKPELVARITYYYDEDAVFKTVTHVLFHFTRSTEDNFNMFKQALTDKFGVVAMKQKISRVNGIELSWDNVPGGYQVELCHRTYHISKR